jgi:hypothetical protein
MIQPFSHPNYGKNSDLCGPDDTPCVICGCPVKTKSDAVWLVVGDGNSRFLTKEEAAKSEDSGAWPIGAGCLRKYRKDLAPFLP